jgi:hypothetical protein
MESTLGIIGTIIGVLGFFLAAFIAVRQVQAEKWQKQELERQKQELEIQKQEKVRNDRLMFLADRIFDSSIPRELRQPFYEEYISMKGNGTAVRFWLLEGEREKKAIQPV